MSFFGVSLRRPRRWVGAVVLFGLAVRAPVADPASASFPRQKEAFFSVPGPRGDEVDLSLENELRKLLALAPAGSTVRIGLYTFSRTPMAEAIVAASRRGVDVRLLLGEEFAAVRLLEEQLPEGSVLLHRDADGKARAFLGDHIQHNKFFLFSELDDGSRHVVVQSSANLTEPQIRLANHLVIVRDDRALYHAYLSYWNDMARREAQLDRERPIDGETGTRVYFFPRRGADAMTGDGDPIVEILRAIGCEDGGSVHVAMGYFTDGRLGVATALVDAKARGCSVRVIAASSHLGPEIASILESGTVDVVRFPLVHSKYMLVEGIVEGDARRWVFTGSHNLTAPALERNDEALLRIDAEPIYTAFLDDWWRQVEHPDAVCGTGAARAPCRTTEMWTENARLRERSRAIGTCSAGTAVPRDLTRARMRRARRIDSPRSLDAAARTRASRGSGG